jgi:hypothetical protein
MKIARACRDRAVKPLYSLLTIQLSLDQRATVFTAASSLRLTFGTVEIQRTSVTEVAPPPFDIFIYPGTNQKRMTIHEY